VLLLLLLLLLLRVGLLLLLNSLLAAVCGIPVSCTYGDVRAPTKRCWATFPLLLPALAALLVPLLLP
jgi:hypothetical protein